MKKLVCLPVLAVALLAPIPAFAQALVVASCGTQNYTAAIGQLHQLTMNTAGYLCVSTTTLLTTGVQATEPKKQEEPKK